MLYSIIDKGLVISGDAFDIKKAPSVYLTTTKDYEYLSDKYSEFKTYKKTFNTSGFIEHRTKYSYVTLTIPSKISTSKRSIVDIIIFNDRIFIIDDFNYSENIINEIFKSGEREGYSLTTFLWDFLNTIVQKDIVFLSELEKQLTLVEEKITSDNIRTTNNRLYDIKKHLMRYCRFYTDLLFIIDGISESVISFNSTEEVLFSQLSRKLERLKSEGELLREYSFQIQDMYNTEISVRQNDIMKTLTIVTTIVMPLSLITGWYGMNFKNMPEINTTYGYYIVSICSIIIVVICIWICKKKKYF